MTAAPLVLFLGNVRHGEYESLRERGLGVGLLRDVAAHSWSVADDEVDLVLPWDPAGPVAGLAAQVVGVRRDRPVAAVLNQREIYVEQFAALLAALGEPAMAAAQVAALRSKRLMRARFAERIGPDATGACAPVTSAGDLRAFGAAHGWPVVLKPSLLYSSLFVVPVAGPGEAAGRLAEVTAGLAAHVAAKGLGERFLGVQAEAFLHGTNHSVDVLADAAGRVYTSPVVDVLTGQELGTGDFHHFARLAPSRADPAAVAAMRALAAAAARALDLRRTAGHVEFILTPDGPRLLEVGLRPGGHRNRMLRLGYGTDFAGGYLDVMTGHVPDMSERRRTPSAIVTPFPATAGCFLGVHGLDRVRALPGYRSHRVYGRPGDTAGKASQGHWQTLSVELSGATMPAVEEDVAAIAGMPDLVAVGAQ
jgi:biotin carboxylase